MTNKQRRDLVAYAKELTKHGKHSAAQSVYELLNQGR
jgi:alkylhydroperoxidase family enzyme